SQHYDRAERKTGDDDFARVRLAVEKIIERDLRVGAFTSPFIELARAQSDAAKVEPQCLEAALVQSLRRAEDDLVVHSAAVQRVWVQDQRDPLGLIAFRAIDRFKPPVRRRNEKISRRIHRSIRQQNFESPRPLRFGHRLYAFGQWVFARDERLDVHPAGFEQPERVFKTPAARTDHAHLINYYPGSVESDLAAKSGLQDNRAARPDQIERKFHSARRPARFDHEIEARRLCSDDFSRHAAIKVVTTKDDLRRAEFRRFDSGARREFQLGVVFADQGQVAPRPRDHARNQLPQFAVADNGDAMRSADLDLVEDLERGPQRLGEDGLPVADAVGHGQQILRRQAQIFGERPVAPANAERGPIRAMTRIVPEAKTALSAAHFDFAHDAAAYLRPVGRLFDDADKLVSERAVEAGVAARDLDVRVANSRHRHPHQRLAGAARDGRIGQFQLVVFKAQSSHL